MINYQKASGDCSILNNRITSKRDFCKLIDDTIEKINQDK